MSAQVQKTIDGLTHLDQMLYDAAKREYEEVSRANEHTKICVSRYRVLVPGNFG